MYISSCILNLSSKALQPHSAKITTAWRISFGVHLILFSVWIDRGYLFGEKPVQNNGTFQLRFHFVLHPASGVLKVKY